jgi:2-methylcitrate dehydratase PrpD
LLRGDGAPTAFTDEVVNMPEIIALRDRVTATANPDCHEASVDITVTFNDGTTLTKHVERAIGSHDVPLTDAQIDTKFSVQSALVIGEERTAKLLAKSWQAEELADVGEVARASVPS